MNKDGHVSSVGHYRLYCIDLMVGLISPGKSDHGLHMALSFSNRQWVGKDINTDQCQYKWLHGTAIWVIFGIDNTFSNCDLFIQIIFSILL